MGGRNSKSNGQPGIQTHELYTFVGYITGVYDDVVSKRMTPAEGRNLIQHSLTRMARYTLESSRPKTPNKIFVSDELLVEIYEKYRDADGMSGWSIVLQFKPSAKTFKALHGVPGSLSITSTPQQPSQPRVAPSPNQRQAPAPAPIIQRVPQEQPNQYVQ